ncbi:MAG: Mevalonate kinase [Vezdaea aestivalis]|nr:MAG: Mevalonate kinase [Vezdaea aestivalis]
MAAALRNQAIISQALDPDSTFPTLCELTHPSETESPSLPLSPIEPASGFDDGSPRILIETNPNIRSDLAAFSPFLKVAPPEHGGLLQSRFNESKENSFISTMATRTAQIPIRPPGISEAEELLNGARTNGQLALKTNGVNGKKNARNSTREHLERKVSSPLQPAFLVSAPGKVIVYGEHAVVYGKSAIAAAISLRSYLLVTALSKSQRTITLRFPDISLSHTWLIDDLPWATFAHPAKKKYYYDLVTSLDEELIDAMKPFISTVSTHLPEEPRKIHQAAASAFLYLFLSLGSRNSPPCIYTLRSTIPIGAGLGSSASISVCLSAALLLQIRTLAGPHPDQPPDEAQLQLERINRWAFVGEMCIHGNPSGVDNTVASGGRAVLFKREDYSKPPRVVPLRNFPELPLLLVNTRQSRSTAGEVARVAALKRAHPIVTEMMLNSIDTVTESAHELITSKSFSANDEQCLQHLGELIRINHGLLVSLGVSHPRLDRIREIVDHAGIGWTKLTGAGGGGCAITMLRPDVPLKTIRDLETRLDTENYEKFETTLGCEGVGVLMPAVLKNGTTEVGGEEIDLEKFLEAADNAALERLVGVGVHEKRENWKFWKP